MGFFDKINNGSANNVKPSNANTGNKSVSIQFSDIPETLDAFQALPQAAMTSEFDTAALTVIALTVYTQDKETGIAMLNFLKGPKPLSPYEKQFLADRLNGKEYVARSYFEGTSPDNDYMPTTPYTITVSTNPYSYSEESYTKLFIRSSGADSPRSVTLRKAKDGKWYLWEQFLLPDIRQPESLNPWA